MRKYILVIDTLCEGVRPAWWDDQDKPVVHNTLREANLELVEEIEDLIARAYSTPEDIIKRAAVYAATSD